MSETDAASADPYEPGHYEIRIAGHLDEDWIDWFGGLTLTLEDSGNTLLSGPVADQAALHGLLRKVRDLGRPLLAVSRVEPAHGDAAAVNKQQVG
jgi:hypothetical protein